MHKNRDEIFSAVETLDTGRNAKGGKTFRDKFSSKKEKGDEQK